MLSSSSQTFAVGHVVYNGVHFWVQEFGTSLVGGTETPANDDVTTATVNVSADQVTQKTVQAPAPVTLELNQGTELPLVNVTMTLTEPGALPPRRKHRPAGRTIQRYCEGGGQSGGQPSKPAPPP